jgi:predicted dehydrogenase
MKWGLVGYGSIGKRHADNINTLGDDIVVVTNNRDCALEKADSIEKLINVHAPEIILICNETSLHETAYREIRARSKELPILIEKPVFDRRHDFQKDSNAFVAYCLRFNPLVLKLKEKIKNSKIVAAQFYVGQYLPTWRPGRDYRATYSAKKELGGGVLRDLSHELDIAYYLLGDLNLQFCKSDKVGSLEITSDDYFCGFFSAKNCSNVSIEMNYLDRIVQRYFVLHADDMTIKVDFIKSEITTNKTIENFSFDKNEMYVTMLKNMKNKNYTDLSSFEDGLKILDLISQAETK